jgi:hypothetical protein
VSALAEQHERWLGVRDRLWRPPVAFIDPPHLRLVPPPEEPPKSPWQYMPVAPYDHCSGSNFVRPLRAIILDTARKHGMTFKEITSRRRFRPIVAARHEAMWRCSHETTASLPAIGRAFGGYDHTTVLNAIRKHQERMDASN